MGSTEPDPVASKDLTVIPASQATWADLTAIFDSAAEPRRCSCQYFKTRGRMREQATDGQRRAGLREQSGCDDQAGPGNPAAAGTSGLVAYLSEGPEGPGGPGGPDGPGGRVPVGWVAVEPRTAYPRLLGKPTVWRGRTEDKEDDQVWSVTCFVVRKGYRRRGVSYALAAAAAAHARDHGARAVEGYAMRTQPGKEITWGELYVGAVQVYADAGFREVSAPSLRRVVMRIDFG